MGDKAKYQTMPTPRALLNHLPLHEDENEDGEDDEDVHAGGACKYVVVVPISSGEWTSQSSSGLSSFRS